MMTASLLSWNSKNTIFPCLILCLVLQLSGAEMLLQTTELRDDSSAAQPATDTTTADVEAEIVAALGDRHGVSNERLRELQTRLEPSFRALEKNAEGRVSHSGVRWMLHQHFATEHGWVMVGLERSSGALLSRAEGPTAILRERLPAYVQTVLEAKFARAGFSLADTVAMAATLEQLILDDGLNTLEKAYRLCGLTSTSPLSRDELADVIHAYMMVFALHLDPAHKGLFRETRAKLVEMYPGEFGWPFGVLGRDVLEEYLDGQTKQNPFGAAEQSAETRGYGFTDAAAVVRSIGERFGQEQNLECKELKTALVEQDPDQTGRVALLDFYKVGGVGDWRLAEEREVLRRMGALDETSPTKGPQVLIPNYIHARSNCVEASGLYKVCCLNECEGLLRAFEEEFQAPLASPEQIEAFVERTHTSSMDGPKVLSLALVDQLGQIAAMRPDGMIALHTRLFAEWLHFAFPRECPYPHQREARNGTSENSISAASWEELQHFVTDDKVSAMAETEAAARAVAKDRAAQENPGGRPEFSQKADELTEANGGLHPMWTWEDETYVSIEALVLQGDHPTNKKPYLLRTAIYLGLVGFWLAGLRGMALSTLKSLNMMDGESKKENPKQV